jgi:glycerol-3-phosphate dehydrogenase (NAD(P)+)
MALTLAKKGAQVSVWDIGEAQATAVNTSRENKAFLPGFTIPETVTWYHDAIPALEGAELILVAIPTQFLRKFMAANHRSIPAHVPFGAACQGCGSGYLAYSI